MKNKPFILLVICLLFLTATSFAQHTQQRVSILGDSYSTFNGYLTPDTNYCWYGIAEHIKINDVHQVKQTWWYQLINQQGYQLERNNSFSGATICNTGYNGDDFSDRSFVTRLENLGNPDIIFIFGGTNDTWAGSPLGEYQYEDWNKADLYHFRPAFCYLLSKLSEQYPGVKIYNITNTELSAEITDSMEAICRYYGITNINLQYIDKQAGHPSVNGMKAICKQVTEELTVNQH
ncbi:MAG: SGNH/GDSL hydrolase family protein [Tannerellaceae bacterium]|nr:SGNH/GDSL hydrolase family protein [Tannerellaceae bacterium]